MLKVWVCIMIDSTVRAWPAAPRHQQRMPTEQLGTRAAWGESISSVKVVRRTTQKMRAQLLEPQKPTMLCEQRWLGCVCFYASVVYAYIYIYICTQMYLHIRNRQEFLLRPNNLQFYLWNVTELFNNIEHIIFVGLPRGTKIPGLSP